MSLIKRHNGSSFVDINPKKFNGSSWVDVEAYKWDGSKWVNMTSQQYTNTWNATWTQTYRQSGTKRTDYRADKMCQGNYGSSDPWGTMKSLCGFGDIQSAIAGARIDKVELFLRSEHWWYTAGGTAIIGYHNHSSEPTNYSSSAESQKSQKFNYRGHAQWITMPNALGEGIRDGRYKGISLFANSLSKEYYGVFNSAWDGAGYAPQLKITYTK